MPSPPPFATSMSGGGGRDGDEWSGVPIDELLAVPELQLEVAVLPPGTGRRRVRWAQTTEQVDPTPYLRPDELVCTVGAMLQSEAAITTFVAALTGAPVAGVCFGTGDVHDEVPPALVALCARRGLPLLTMPRGVPFLVIGDHLVSHQQAQVEAARRRVALGRLLRAVGDGLADAEVLAESLPQLADPSSGGAGAGGGSVVLSAWPVEVTQALAQSLPDATLGQTESVTYAVLADGSGAAAQVLAGAAERLTTPCGYSSPVGPGGLRAAVVEAREALRLAQRSGGACGPERLTTLEGLLAQQPPERLRAFVEQLVLPLEASDRRHGSAVLSTLRAFLDCDGSVVRTARQQYVHVNTVRHRLARVAELTGRDPLDFADRAALAIAVWTYDRHRGRHS